MRIRNRNQTYLKLIFTILIIVSPFSYFVYFGIRVGNIYDEILSFQFEAPPPDMDKFLTANYTRLDEMARVYDDLFEKNHLPLNYTATCDYVDGNYTEIARYGFSDNGALWTGVAMAGWVFHYIAAINEGNSTDEEYSLEVIKRMVDGMSMLMIVPNGGLGPEFPGILGRGWAGPEHKDLHPSLFNYHIRHYNGTGAYSQYRWRGHTSNDEYGGYYMGLALCLKYVDDIEVQETVGLIIEQLANYMKETNFLGINGPGGPSGVDQKPRVYTGAFWLSLLFKMASMVNPDEYLADYYHFVSAEMAYVASTESSQAETMANYYAYNFAHCVVFSFLLLEGIESEIGKHYYNGYMNSLRKYTEFHRNAWFNIVYLALSAEVGDLTNIERDIEDQLMRLEINHFPDRHYPLLPAPPEYEVVQKIMDIKSEIENHNWATLYDVAFIETDWDEVYFTEPLTVEYRRTGHYMWERNAWENTTYWHDAPLHEEPGMTFTTPYWIARAFGFILPSGIREV
jgi:hypothetical protein